MPVADQHMLCRNQPSPSLNCRASQLRGIGASRSRKGEDSVKRKEKKKEKGG